MKREFVQWGIRYGASKETSVYGCKDGRIVFDYRVYIDQAHLRHYGYGEEMFTEICLLSDDELLKIVYQHIFAGDKSKDNLAQTFIFSNWVKRFPEDNAIMIDITVSQK